MNPPPKFIRVFLVEGNVADERLVAEMLREFGENQFILCGVFRRLSEAIEALENSGNADVILLDLSLPDSQGMATFLRLMEAAPDQPMIVLSGQNDAEFGVEIIRQGAQEFLLKSDLTGQLLVRTIHCAMERKQMALALRAACEELEKRVEEHSEALNDANRRVSEVVKQWKTAQNLAIRQEHLLEMEQMAGKLAHDFNNALSPILAHSERLLRRPGALSDEAELRKALSHIYESAQHCAEVVLRLRNCLTHDEFASLELVPEASPEEASKHSQPADVVPSKPLKGLRILAVEDDPNIREILGIYLTDEGHIVALAADGAEAFTKFEKDRFDLLLTDYSMPNMNGDSLAAAIRAIDSKIRIALLTGFGSQLPQGAPLRLEVDAIIPKPFTFETLRQGIAEAMGG